MYRRNQPIKYCFNIDNIFSIEFISNRDITFTPKIRNFLCSSCDGRFNIIKCQVFIEKEENLDIKYKKIFNKYDIIKYRNELSEFYSKGVSIIEEPNYNDLLPYTFYNFLFNNGLVDVLKGEFIFFHKSGISVIFNIERREAVVFSLSKKPEYFIIDDNIFFFILSIATILNGGFILHSSFVILDNKGYIFCGNSGAGKSTITQLLDIENAFNDEAIIILNKNNRWEAVPTPFYQYRIVDNLSFFMSHKIDSLFFLKQSPICKLKSVEDIDKIRGIEFILKNLIHFQVIFTPFIKKKLFNRVMDFSKDINFYDFYFNLNKEDILRSLGKID